MDNYKYELVLCIVNAGFSQNVMQAARSAGAKGGTIIRARGSANPEAEEFFNITIQPDKELIMILVPQEIKDEILKTIYQEAGLGAEAQGIAFSLPVNRTTTLRADGPAPEKK
ncbi:MAG: P-II family nitrogen regulator [Bacteroidales bacterium]|nr:P-II family nitrogen regulator [Bacteroidales bacterium]